MKKSGSDGRRCAQCEDELQLMDAELATAREASNRVWRGPNGIAEREDLLKQCDKDVLVPLRRTFDDAFRGQQLDKVKEAITASAYRPRIRAELQRQTEAVSASRLRYAFNRMSQGKTKVC